MINSTILDCNNTETMEWSIRWAHENINQFNANKEFEPFDALMGNESKAQKLYSLCVEYLHNLDELTDKFRTDRNNIVCN